MDDEHSGESDGRLIWMMQKAIQTMKINEGKWIAMSSEEDARRTLLTFLEVDDNIRLVVYLNNADQVIVSFDFPATYKKKSIVFLKKRPCSVKADSIEEDMIWEELSISPLEQLASVIDCVYLPLLADRSNRKTWPLVLSEDVLGQFQKFSGDISCFVGKTKGQTKLACPPLERKSLESASRDRAIVHNLETSVVGWTRQIKNILELESSGDVRSMEERGFFPGSEIEFRFWEAKLKDLENVREQLFGQDIQKLVRVLEITQSSYLNGIQSLLSDLDQGIAETRSITTALQPLSKYVMKLEQAADFVEAKSMFRPIIHMLALIWEHCSSYASSMRMMNLIRLVCNDIISMATANLNGNSILRDEPPESLPRLVECLRCCAQFKTLYFETRGRINQSHPRHKWAFENGFIFERLDRFLERVRDLHDVIKSSTEFVRLEKVEVGFGKGKTMRLMIEKVFSEFLALYKRFEEAEYEIFDLKDDRFDSDFLYFCQQVRDFDRRLCFVIEKTFEEAQTPQQGFKALETFEPQVSRDLIRAELSVRYQQLLTLYSEDLDEVSDYLSGCIDSPPVLSGLPRVSGILSWAKGLFQRIDGPMSKFHELRPHLLESDEGMKVVEKYDHICRLLDGFRSRTFAEWTSSLDQVSLDRLNDFILRRTPQGLLAVNFDEALSACMLEVKYLSALEMEVPPGAVEIYHNKEEYRNHISNLQMVVGQYNTIMRTILDVERPLVQDRITIIDRILEEGVSLHTWRSEAIDDFIERSRVVVKDLYGRMNFVKGNVKSIENILHGWLDIKKILTGKRAEKVVKKKSGRLFNMVAFWRSGQEKLDEEEPESPSSSSGLLSSKVFSKWKSKATVEISDVSDIIEQGHKIHKLVASSGHKLEVDRSSNAWRDYVMYVNAIVEDGILSAVRSALTFLISNMKAVEKSDTESKKGKVTCLLTMRLELRGSILDFSPSIDGREKSLQQIVDGWMDQSFRLASYANRLDDPRYDFTEIVERDEGISALRREVVSLLGTSVSKLKEIANNFSRFSSLYSVDRDEYLQKFLSGEALGREIPKENELDDSPPQYEAPSLEDFESAIVKYGKLRDEVKDLSQSISFGWVKVDLQPAREALSNEAAHWRFMFLDYLKRFVEGYLDELHEYVGRTTGGLKEPVVEGDYDSLVRSMEHMSSFRKRERDTAKMFEPLRSNVSSLRKFGIEVESRTVELLDGAEDIWNGLSKLYYQTKEQLAPLQNKQTQIIQQEEDVFARKLEAYRRDFLSRGPFEYEMDMFVAYDALDVLNIEVRDLEYQVELLLRKQDLFDLMPFNPYHVSECRTDLRMLKQVWDVIGLVQFQFSSWRQIPFVEVKTEMLEDEMKKLSKEIRALDKRVRSWAVYVGLDEAVRNFSTSIPLISLLRNPNMRKRHWDAIMKTTGVRFELTKDFRLEDLMRLELHRFVGDVETIVEQSTKEAGMEKSLKELDEHWRNLTLEYYSHKNTDLKLIKVNEETVDTMEQDQVLVQAMISSKFIGIFRDEVDAWIKRLGTVDSVLNIFLDVQRMWAYLENIFIGSEDIRQQLREDAERFDYIDVFLKRILKEVELTPNVMEACCKPQLEEKLTSLMEDLQKCEKSLQEYLETKKKAFPRFYFMSTPDLLDVLSKGGQSPHDVMVHIPKLIEKMKTLSFDEIGGELTKIATGMYSREGEYVEFANSMSCTGQVENWLNVLLDTMRDALRAKLALSVIDYDSSDQTREEWIAKWPAQIALVASQIWFTTEVNTAFESIEEGNENALKDYNKKQIDQLNRLIVMVQGELPKDLRQKVMSMVTIEVHSRDIIASLIRDKVENGGDFAWQSQLRLRWDDQDRDCHINICDAHFIYGYEYLGNGPRLVITPLTDRIYITLTQSLHLIMGGAPAGPAGTGKTETTKDLAAQLGKPVYVFNCSDQMDYRGLGDIFKGLASSGSWGCFDEFNRIAVEVLSVVSTQFKSILDAIREGRSTFSFPGEEVNLDPTIGAFITMNPGYLGRTELPESLKALFRPVTVVVPDFELICENMLMAEGFLDARKLARKFITLYQLNKDLLSKQDHYDWGLRAIKSVLVVAGSLKRAEPQIDEEGILMRALRDFNKPKIVTEDDDIFMGLLGDLFPGLDLPRKKDEAFENTVREEIRNLGWQAEEGLVLKCVQLEELLHVRHSIFIIGFTGVGKSVLWKSLARTKTVLGEKTTTKDLNPKAITSNELYGCFNPSTKEWRDGLLSTIMKDLGKIPDSSPKWIILDGDLDTEWIESMNSVMDDNKILTLANNDRIPLYDHMRMIFEIAHLKYATPATVSRAGIIYISEVDIGYFPFLKSWTENFTEDVEYRQFLLSMFEKYVPVTIEKITLEFKHIIPLSTMNLLGTLTNLLGVLLNQVPEDLLRVTVEEDGQEYKEINREVLEKYFVFCSIWAFGGAFSFKDGVNFRSAFNKFWRAEHKSVKLPEGEDMTVYDFFLNDEHEWTSWEHVVPDFVFDPDIPVSSMIVQTSESVAFSYLMNKLTDHGKPVMFVGNAGCGKTRIVQRKLANLKDGYSFLNINFNYFTDSEALQNAMEGVLEKRGGRNYGPVGGKNLIYFIDDLNMSKVDQYGTQSPIALLRQHLDYQHWYDRYKLTVKDIRDIQYIACMNPTAGSFTVNPRFQRHFATFAVGMPKPSALRFIVSNILENHLKRDFAPLVVKLGEKIGGVLLALHSKISQTFVKTAIKFHYEFNMRHISNVLQGLLMSTATAYQDPIKFVRLWIHETYRVYADRLIDEDDFGDFNRLMSDTVRESFPDLDQESLLPRCSLFSSFAAGLGADKTYNEVSSFDRLGELLGEALNEYNEENARMDLVLFEDAMRHICRISRILDQPQGNALLVGVGGSGKQSLSRLAAHLCGYSVYQIVISRTYGIADFKEDLMKMYRMTGVKGEGVVFLFTDAQITNEKFLVYINDVLSSGNIPDLFPDDIRDEIISALSNEAKANGVLTTNEAIWEYFISKVRNNLHTCLCFSPVGDAFRVRVRRFPALVNCTVIDWFFPWPEEALLSVADKFLREVDLGGEEMHNRVVRFIASAHQSVNDASVEYKLTERRFNYTTPKSFLELITLYKTMLDNQRKKSSKMIETLENGLIKLEKTASDVAVLEERLKKQTVVVKQAKDAAEAILETVAKEQQQVDTENELAKVEAAKATEVQRRVTEIQLDADTELQKAEPAVRAAEAALNTLNKNNLSEMKAFNNPPEEVKDVLAAVLILLSPKSGVMKDRSWGVAQKRMKNVDAFLTELQTFDKTSIPDTHVKALQPQLDNPKFTASEIVTKSVAAAGICDWVVNIVGYYKIHCEVEPKRIALAGANVQLREANDTMDRINAKLAALEAKVAELRAQFEEANEEKLRVEREAEQTSKQLNLAQRLVRALSSEKVRWAESVGSLKRDMDLLVGDVLLSAAFLSYIGPFSLRLRRKLVNERWLPELEALNISLSESARNPIALLTDDATIAEWNTERLPSDPVSIQNGTIFTECLRWPLIIDPQLQGITWVKTRYEDRLKILRLGQKNMLDNLKRSIENGDPVLIENIGESVDAILAPVIQRAVKKKGHEMVVKIGEDEVYYHKDFRLFLHTKLSNPHYQPELQAETTLINFMVTEDGLEEQLLALVVRKERPDLEQQKADLINQQNDFKIKLKKLEANVLHKLSNAGDDILSDVELIENLEQTKVTAEDIAQKVIQAKVTEKQINEAREQYRPVAARGALLYFLLDSLSRIEPMYQFSLHAFEVVFSRAIDQATPSDELKLRLEHLLDSITYAVFSYARRGLFEKHKLIFSAQLCFRILVQGNKVDPDELDFLLRCPRTDSGPANPMSDWLKDSSWAALLSLRNLERFQKLTDDMEGSSKRWKEWAESDSPEYERLPGEWKNAETFQRLLVIRAIRPDRVASATQEYVSEIIGSKYVDAAPFSLEATFFESSPSTPLLFILFPGADPVKDVENLGKKMGFTAENRKFINVSMGQGQEAYAEASMDRCSREGGWVMLQNIHLMQRWLPTLERRLEAFSEGAHKDFRLYLSAEPQPPTSPQIPQGILQTSIKIANEPPQTLKANIMRAWANFNQDKLDSCMKSNEFRQILFSLCFFHGLVLGRRKFGFQGWSRSYSFNNGDLTISADVLFNYLETNPKIPWEDLRYIFGEIMYGGHITDYWDRRTCSTYLEVLMRDELFDGMELSPGFRSPSPLSYEEYVLTIQNDLPSESPILFDLPSNAEIVFLTAQADFLYNTVIELGGGAGGGMGESKDRKVQAIIEDITTRLPENPLDMNDISGRIEQRSPYILVLLQECERMNLLLRTIRISLKELLMGLNGELTISEAMDAMINSLFFDRVPGTWEKVAYPSLRPLGLWFGDLLERVRFLQDWAADLNLPKSVWLSGLFSPMTFLTAVMQTTARRQEWPLDRVVLQTEMLKKEVEEISSAPRDGTHIHGMYLQGARWDRQSNSLRESTLSDLFPSLPVMWVRAVTSDKKETKGVYECPVYVTTMRGPTYVFTSNLRTADKPVKWILAGTAVLLEPGIV